MAIVRLDAHVHLYDLYSLSAWTSAAVRGLRREDSGVVPLVIVVDREGQDSLERFRREATGWTELCEGRAGVYQVEHGELLVIRGAQYVAKERVEVLGLGCFRGDLERKPAEEILASIRESGGVPCLPWSPGKWLGARGKVIRRLLEEGDPRTFVVGDVAIRAVTWPRSSLLARAQALGYRITLGTDPLPFKGEERLVGSFGQEFEVQSDGSKDVLVRGVLDQLSNPRCQATEWGRRNPVLTALERFVASNVPRARLGVT
jgi:hypothetical protein